jgi:RNA polymerase sigma-70 factor (ECF subfamily)
MTDSRPSTRKYDSDDVRRMMLLQDGELEQMEILVARHRTKLIQFLRRMTGSIHVAEDLAQDVLLSVYMARGSYQPAAEFTTWLYCIATNRARKWARRRALAQECLDGLAPRQAHRFVSSHQPDPERALLEREFSQRIEKALAQLPERQRCAVRLAKFEGYEYTEIAARMGCSVSAVKSILFRTHSTLRQSLGEYQAQAQPDATAEG